MKYMSYNGKGSWTNHSERKDVQRQKDCEYTFYFNTFIKKLYNTYLPFVTCRLQSSMVSLKVRWFDSSGTLIQRDAVSWTGTL